MQPENWKQAVSQCFAFQVPCQLLQFTDAGPTIVKLGAPQIGPEGLPARAYYAGHHYRARRVDNGEMLTWHLLTGMCIGTTSPTRDLEDLVESVVSVVGGPEQYDLLLLAASLNIADAERVVLATNGTPLPAKRSQ